MHSTGWLKRLAQFTSLFLLLLFQSRLALSSLVASNDGSSIDVGGEQLSDIEVRGLDTGDGRPPPEKHVKNPREEIVTRGDWRIKMSQIKRSDIYRYLKCHNVDMHNCVYDIMTDIMVTWSHSDDSHAVIQGTPPKHVYKPPKKIEFLVGRGSSNAFENHLVGLWGKEKLAANGMFEYLARLKTREPHYLHFAAHGNQTYSVGYHVNETSSPGLSSKISEGKYNFMTDGVWFYTTQSKGLKKKFNGSYHHMKNISIKLTIFIMGLIAKERGIRRGYCLAAHTPLRQYYKGDINHGAFRFGFNHRFPGHYDRLYHPCRHYNQGID